MMTSHHKSRVASKLYLIIDICCLMTFLRRYLQKLHNEPGWNQWCTMLVFTGFICQFGIMPLGAFTAAHLLHLSQAQALVVLIMGCLPGGNASNLVSYWCDGDMDLR